LSPSASPSHCDFSMHFFNLSVRLWVSSLERCLLITLVHFLKVESFYHWFVRALYIFWRLDLYQICNLQTLSLILSALTSVLWH
jgi:hypothetical protein